MTTPASMPAGWYDDPFTDHLQRYWTGDSWTKETRPRPGAVVEAPGVPHVQPAVVDADGSAAEDTATQVSKLVARHPAYPREGASAR